MEKVNLYIYSSIKSVKGSGIGIYILEAPDIHPEKGSNVLTQGVPLEGTRQYCVLALLKCALTRLRRQSDLHIYVDDIALYGDLINNLPIWVENMWITKRGTPVKYKDLWIQVCDLLKYHEWEVEHSKEHKYYKWQQFEAERRRHE